MPSVKPFLEFCAKEADKKAPITTVSQALHDSDKEAFHILLNPIVNNYNTTALGLSKTQSAEFKQQLITTLSIYLSGILLKTRMEIYDKIELQAMAALYTSPVGKKITKKLPLIRELQNIESLDTASSQILTKDELAYAKQFANSDIGKSIKVKTDKVNQRLLTKVKADNALEKIVAQFSQEYLKRNKVRKE